MIGCGNRFEGKNVCLALGFGCTVYWRMDDVGIVGFGDFNLFQWSLEYGIRAYMALEKGIQFSTDLS
jgi:hypothetical protein